MSGVAAPRVSWRFSPRGTVVTCTVVPDVGLPWLEVRSRSGTLRRDVAGLGATTQVLPLDSGDIYLCSRIAGVDVVSRLKPTGCVELVLRSAETQGAMLAAAGTPDDDLLILLRTSTGTTRVQPVGGTLPASELEGCVVAVAGVGGTRALVTQVTPDGMSGVRLLDLAHPEVPPASAGLPARARVSGSAPAAGLAAVLMSSRDEHALCLFDAHEGPASLRELQRSDRDLDVVALAADGSRLVTRTEDGALTRLVVVDTTTGRTQPLALPPLVVLGRGHLSSSLLRVPVSLSGHPGTLLEVDLDTGRHVVDAGRPARARPALELVRTSSAPLVESVVVGDPRSARHVVVALHGGPVEAWRAHHDPLLHALGRAGVAVVAPNVRGSSCYGADHVRALVGHWGGPDLADVLRVVADVRAARHDGLPEPVLLGTSYGAWLAVLAAAELTSAVRGCVALAPFTSGARLLEDGGPVSALVRRLGGETSPDLCDRVGDVECPVLLIHGAHDDVVLPAHSATLESALRAHSRARVERRVAADAGHDLQMGTAAPRVRSLVLDFITGSRLAVHDGDPAIRRRSLTSAVHHR